MDRISRGWALTVQSWEVLKKDRSLMMFPILSTTFAIPTTFAIFAPALLWDGNGLVVGIAALAGIYALAFIAIFFNVALAACAVRSLHGEDTKVSEGIKAAMHRIGPILGWTLVATTVGVILRTLGNRTTTLGRVAFWLAGAAWGVATFFVVPVLALEGSGPWQSLQRSATVVKARWGEGATGTATISIGTFVVAVAILSGGGMGSIALSGVDQELLAGVVSAFAIAGVIVVAMISAALSQIFRVALYRYALTGEAVGGFDHRVLQSAFSG